MSDSAEHAGDEPDEGKGARGRGGSAREAEEQGGDAPPASRARFEALSAEHMPRDFSVSLDAYRRGGTDRFLGQERDEREEGTALVGFEPTYTDIVDYIVRITHRIWEEKDIGYIYDTYSHDCRVWDDFGLQYGRDKIVADTVHTNNAFPDIRLVADEVIWAGDETVGFHTSHRCRILGTNTGFSRYGPPTGRRIELWCIANCVARDNEIFHEHVIYDTAGMLQQLGVDVVAMARRLGTSESALVPNFAAGEPRRIVGQGKPARPPIPEDAGADIEAFVRAAFQRVWNRRDFAAIDRVYAPDILCQGSTGRVYRGHGQLRAFVLSMVAMFPDLALSVDDLYWMGSNPDEGFLVSIRWSATGTHRGHGPYGEPTGREVHLWGITQWTLEGSRVRREWMLFNEFGVLMQLHGARSAAVRPGASLPGPSRPDGESHGGVPAP